MTRETVIIIQPCYSLAVVNTNFMRQFNRMIKLGYEPSFYTGSQAKKEIRRGMPVTFQIPKQEITIK